MKRSLFILPIIAMAFVLSGCTAMMSMSAYGTSDLYKTDNRAEVATRLKNEAEVARLEAEARQAQWEARLAEANASAAEAEYYAVVNQQPNYSNVVADDYQSAYARRLYGFQSPTYRMPSSYYNMLNSSSIYYVTAYDPAYYNIMVSGDQVWVEPKYITSMFGSWGATNVTFGIYASPWNYGWSYRVDPFYYSMWGYPHYSWYDWNWNMCYNPFYYDWYWGGYYPHHHHHHHPVPPPSHRPDNRPGYHPDHTTGSGASVGPGNMNGNRVNTGSRYTSPTSNRNYGATDSRGNSRPTSGSTSQGFNSSSVRPSTGTSKDSRFNVVESNTRVNTSVGAASNSNTTKSSGSNFRQGTSQNSSTRTTISSGSSRVGASTSSGSSRSSSSSNFRTSSSSSNSSSSFRSSSSSSSSSSSRSSSGSFRSSGSSSGSSSSGSFRSSGSSSGSSRR